MVNASRVVDCRAPAATRTAPGWARRLAGDALAGWGLSGMREVVELVVSELVTNSVIALEDVAREVPSVPSVVRFRLVAERRPGGPVVTVEVWDQIPAPPVRRSPDATQENGRGLLLVETLAERWGWYWPDHRVDRGREWCPADPGLIEEKTARFGKVTWAVLAGGDGALAPGPRFRRRAEGA